ncbi:hypothetical protein F5876DRAFT_71873 [Lentinula aff. lateritia]|uniref:Uncharacterized protein n=1 Tax=Lentinula aff. lateritia TaxID=2804960 RepID=A0ACC1UG11_9AGAR|nr:hypothetical protein F5876DRAFT_71873 [Lentinula aff. lateritia]
MVNVTVDDSASSVIYYPSGAWNARSASVPCSSCTANPDVNQTFDNTFHDGTFNPVPGSNSYPNVPLTASMTFNGIAVYVFCALAESSTSPDGDSDMDFYIDGFLNANFVKTAPGNNNTYDYSVAVFASDSLTPGTHNLTIQNGHVGGTKSLILLDKIVYTTVDDTLSSSTLQSSSLSPSQTSLAPNNSSAVTKGLGDIVGPAVAVPVVVVILLATLGIFFFLKRRKQQQPRTISAFPRPMTSAWTIEPVSVPPSPPTLSGRAPPSLEQNLNSEVGG